MHIDLKCKNCAKMFSIPFGVKEFALEKCPLCGATISHSDTERIYTITENIHGAVGRLTSIEICGISAEHDPKEEKVKLATNVFQADMENIFELFQNATPEIKEQITSMLDTLYLLMNRNVRDENIEALEGTRTKLRALFYDKISADHAEMRKNLFGEQEETNNA